MTDSNERNLLELACALADAAAAQSMRYFRTPLPIITKDDLSPVTLADRDAEAAMRRILAERSPGDGIFGEEHGRERLDAGRVWVLDPIDGTRSFITGSPLWGTLIGVLEGGRVRLGMVDMPVLRERWWGLSEAGGRGAIALRNGQPVHASACTRIEDARIVCTSPDIFAPADWQAFDALSGRCAMRRFGGDCYGYAQLAGGTIDLVVETGLQPYDYLGPAGLIEAAGGVITDWQGQPLGLQSDGRVVAAATPELHRAALAALAA
ncbi:inositol monophosphatase family protein [Variovorax sp.]|uniref:inositol monophosphatase family protein n=1 Tax=Variovorax sp. TaxID=1871043 RepID=UPI002D3D0527|nr:inositol monophosphatase family protein [Variovorax sp.]HYP83463.1 inositol monophosphatase family protein [Variovorax sp.]